MPQRFVVEIPNDSLNVELSAFRLTPPPGVSIAGAETSGAETTSREGDTVVWSGSSVAPGDTGAFAFTATLPTSGGAVTFQGEETYVGFGPTGTFPLTVSLTAPAAQAAAGAEGNGEGGSRTALVGAAVMALLTLLLALGGVYAWRESRARSTGR